MEIAKSQFPAGALSSISNPKLFAAPVAFARDSSPANSARDYKFRTSRRLSSMHHRWLRLSKKGDCGSFPHYFTQEDHIINWRNGNAAYVSGSINKTKESTSLEQFQAILALQVQHNPCMAGIPIHNGFSNGVFRIQELQRLESLCSRY